MEKKNNKGKKIAGIDIGKWIEPEEISFDYEIIEDKKKYKRYIIAFLDVLGFADFVNDNTGGDEYKAIDKIERLRDIVATTSKSLIDQEKINYLFISDSFVFVCDPTTINALIRILASIQMRILYECHFLLRGAVTIGEAIIEEDCKYIIGPAFIKAYRLQDKNAIYPRIIVDDAVLSEIEKSPELKENIHIDRDKESFLDYIGIYMENERRAKREIKLLLRNEDVFKYIQEEYDIFNQKEKHNIKQKYGWTIQYLKELGVWESAK